MPNIAAPDTVSTILAVLRERTGMDFTRYRVATVQRRIANRMISVGADSFEDYLTLLRDSEEEPALLLNRVSSKVSRFYRNRASFDLLRTRVLPDLARSGAPLRIWSAGCGCGEEPYSLAMLLEQAGLPGAIEATDIDPAALAAAEGAVYAVEAAAELPAELGARYLAPVFNGSRHMVAVARQVRERVRFAAHDLLSRSIPDDGRFDLVSCRNVLIYLQADVREQVLGTLRRAVRPGGYVFLGEAEWPSEALSASLESLGHSARLFRALEEQKLSEVHKS
jgi:chemotaxis methyl-accepting protein methylase